MRRDLSPEPRPARPLAVAPAGGAGRALKDFGASLVRGALGLALWFFVGGLGQHGAPLYARRQVGAFIATRVFMVMLGLVLWHWGQREPALALGLVLACLALGLLVFTARSYARDALLLAATRDTRDTRPLSVASVSAPRLLATRDLQALALAVDRARRGDPEAALIASSQVEPARLEPDEQRLLVAVEALVARQTGDGKGAALKALSAFPTGALPIDEALGGLCIDGAFHDGARLGALVAAWRGQHRLSERDDTELGKSLRFALVKLEQLDPGELGDAERAELSERARRVGDPQTALRIASAAPSPTGYR